MTWETVIGLEVHAQLQTKTKLFCRCSTAFGQAPNQSTCPVCLGLPGALPALNAEAVMLAVRAALALGCTIHPRSQFARKNYFYPDLPKGYQISQYEEPFATRGGLQIQSRFVRLVRIHMEEDAGKSIHTSGDASLVDYNRACTPLVEIVSEPDLRSAEEAAEYLKELRKILMWIGVCDGNMEEGSFRCDANVSIRRPGDEAFGTRVELKNINSFKFITQAIHYEEARQRDVLEAGGKVLQETRLWDAEAKVTRSMRSKEEAMDYRYFPDPDLPPLVITPDSLKQPLPELPQAKAARFVTLGLSAYDAGVLCDDAALPPLFEALIARGLDAKKAANFVINVVLSAERGSEVKPDALAELLELVADGTISLNVAKDLFPAVRDGASPRQIVAEKGLGQVSDSGAIEAAAAQVIAANQKQVEQYNAGNQKLFGFFVGQTMKAMGGKANPQLVNEVLRRLLA